MEIRNVKNKNIILKYEIIAQILLDETFNKKILYRAYQKLYFV